MRVYIDFNTTNVYDVFSLGFEGILERTFAHHRVLPATHENPTVRENAEYYRSKVYGSHLSSILYKAFGKFHDLMHSQLVCFNTQFPVSVDEDPVEKLFGLTALEVVGGLIPFEKKMEIEYLLFDEDTIDLLYQELDRFRVELIQVAREEIVDAMNATLKWAQKK
jgi:hypothetical protein